ncbi:MAG: ribosome silencing factor [Chitinophagaceae bacterium]|nr:ribosome silencing factor [Chitinophagaceae bacterium]
MSSLHVKTIRKADSASINRQSRLFKTAIEAILEKKGEQVVSLDMRKIPEAVCDFFIICEASTSTQVKAIGDHLQDAIKEACGEIAHRHEGYQHAKWVLVDYVNLVVHIMQPETRRFYQLEEMWSDAPLQHHTDKLPKA